MLNDFIDFIMFTDFTIGSMWILCGESIYSNNKLKRVLGIVLMIIILIVPVVWISHHQKYYSDIEEHEAETIVVHYAGYIESTGSGVRFMICFSDHDRVDVLYGRSITDKIKEIENGSELVIQINPRCNFLMSLRYGYKSIIDFDDGLNKLSYHRRVRLILGLLSYLVFAFVYLVSEKGRQTIKKLGMKVVAQYPGRLSDLIKKTVLKEKNKKKNRISNEQMIELWQMPWEELVSAMYDRDIDKLSGKPVMVVYNEDRNRRFAVVKETKGYSYEFQCLRKYTKEDWFYINAVEGELPAAWESINEEKTHQIYKSSDEALKALKEADEYKTHFSS